mgnify:CR=1 FL=1
MGWKSDKDGNHFNNDKRKRDVSDSSGTEVNIEIDNDSDDFSEGVKKDFDNQEKNISWDFDINSDHDTTDGDLETIAELIKDGFTSGEIEGLYLDKKGKEHTQRVFWSLKYEGSNELTDTSQETIADMIKDGFTSGLGIMQDNSELDYEN